MKNFTNFDLNRGIIIPLNQIIIPFYQLFTSQYSTNSVTGAKLCEAPNILDVGKSVASSKSNLINKSNVVGSTNLVLWGTNLGSTAKTGRLTKIVRYMIELPSYQKSVIVGLLLSDGWLSRTESKNEKNARLGFRQSINKFEYVWYVFNVISHYCERYPYTYGSTRGGKTHYNVTITTRALPCFTLLQDIFYVDSKKIVPKNIYELLTPVALANLIEGDGTYLPGKGLRICTDSFTLHDCIKLMNVLMIRYRLNVTLHVDRGRYRIYIIKSSMPLLISIVYPFMIPSMLYKLGL